MKRLIIFATGNKDKIREICEIITDPETQVVSMKEAEVAADPEEDGTTFEENALIKARSVAELVQKAASAKTGVFAGLDPETELLVMSDDSGLVIDALDGAPGIYSARYMGHETSYILKMNHILDLMKGVPDEKRSARFVAAVAAVVLGPCSAMTGNSSESNCNSEGIRFPMELVVRGTMEGAIGHAIAGEHGFGYDPFFLLPELGVTSAELTDDQKNAISHRGNAMRSMLKELESRGL
ncbi:MAG: non-canonical purine NTP pyrophosphatase [Lachnospiraceae bacterium]|nr:non-canonical purine NTP pyrophosphatase [Lachnospiraceae bacterium]